MLILILLQSNFLKTPFTLDVNNFVMWFLPALYISTDTEIRRDDIKLHRDTEFLYAYRILH